LLEYVQAASCLASAHRVNPWNAQEVADKIHHVLTLPDERRARLHEIGMHYVQTFTSRAWGKKFMNELMIHTARGEEVTLLQHLKYEDLVGPYRAAKSRLIVINYDGGLLEYRKENFKSTSRPSTRVLFELKRISADPRNTVYVYSGRERDSLHEWFATTVPGIGLVGENGFFIKKPHEDKWFVIVGVVGLFCSLAQPLLTPLVVLPLTLHRIRYQLESSLDMAWMGRIQPVLEYFALRTPGSEIQQKEVHMTWHYRRCRPDFGILQARELQRTIGVRLDYFNRIQLASASINDIFWCLP
jgi:trehalose-6-phosphatase